MPNCDFYAAREDHEPLLQWLFADGSCDVYENYSDFERPLRQFKRASDVMAEFERVHADGQVADTVHLQLHVRDAGPRFVPRRVSLNPAACDGAKYRFAAEGWGLIQLYLSTVRHGRIENSHTNHNSQKRAEAWAPTILRSGPPTDWDFKKITAYSGRLNRQIKSLAVAKIRSRVILPGALALWKTGMALSPYSVASSPPVELIEKAARAGGRG